jgi:flagellar basal body P-ring protein FlgI
LQIQLGAPSPSSFSTRLAQFSRRDFLICGGAAMLAGCAGPAIRSQSPEDAEMASLEKQVRLIEAVAIPFGMTYVKAEATALVVGLLGTGSDPPPGGQRAELLADMQARMVDHPNQVMANPNNALVAVRVFLPPAAQKGDPLDIEVRVPPQTETTSLYGGWLMETRLMERANLNGQIHNGNVLAHGEGALLVDPQGGADDKVALLRARILGGAHVLKDRTLGLSLKLDEKSVYISKQIGDALNRRFHTFAHGSQEGVATPKTDQFVELLLHPHYKYNLTRYMSVVRSVALRESPSEQLGRLKLLEKQLLDAVTCATAALRLEAIGKQGIQVLHTGLKSSDLEVRFYSAEALAYLDDADAAKTLAEISREEPVFRAHALAALSALNDVEASDQLRGLLDSPSAETRYGAFRALWAMNPHDALVKGENLGGRFAYIVLEAGGPPMIHVTRSFRPEMVVFGPLPALTLPVSLEAGKSIVVNGREGSEVTVSRFAVHAADQKRTVATKVDDVVRAIVELGGSYPDVVQFLQQAKASGALGCRLEVDALPNPYRHMDASKPDGSGAGSGVIQVATPVPNLFAQITPQ